MLVKNSWCAGRQTGSHKKVISLVKLAANLPSYQVPFTISAGPTKTNLYANSVDPDETALYDRLVWIYTVCHSVFDFRLKPIFGSGVVGWCEGAVYLTSPGRPTDIGLQLGKACYPCSG